MHFKTRLKPTDSLIDMTPLVDVIFLLLVFFMITSDILPLKSLHIEQAKIPIDAPSLTTQLVVVIDDEEVIYVGSDKKIVGLEELQPYLEKAAKKYERKHGGSSPTVTLNIDQRASYGLFLQVLAKTQAAGLTVRVAYRN